MEKIAFQHDHPLSRPTKQWREGDVIVDGPYTISIPDTYDTYDIVVGLFDDSRLQLNGLNASSNRYVIGIIERKDGRMDLEDLSITKRRFATGRIDFKERMNRDKVMVDFGPVRTNGSFKMNKGASQLTLFPYPRNEAFDVEIDMQYFSKQVDPGKVKITALAALTQTPLQLMDHTMDQQRLSFSTGIETAGRYVIEW